MSTRERGRIDTRTRDEYFKRVLIYCTSTREYMSIRYSRVFILKYSYTREYYPLYGYVDLKYMIYAIYMIELGH